MGHTVKTKEGFSKLVMLWPPSTNYLKGETSHELHQPNEQNSVPGCQKDKLLILILTAGMPLGSSMIWGCYDNKGIFLHLGTLTENRKWVKILLLFSYLLKLLSSKLRLTLKGLNWLWETPWLTFHTAATGFIETCGTCGWSACCFCKKRLLSHVCRPDVLATWQQSSQPEN